MNGDRPTRPQFAVELGLLDSVWQVVQLCWLEKAHLRPDARGVLGAIREASKWWNPDAAASEFARLGLHVKPSLEDETTSSLASINLNDIQDHTRLHEVHIFGSVLSSLLTAHPEIGQRSPRRSGEHETIQWIFVS